jgi:SagB-type dehydrogenase family enzyme
MRYHRSSSRQSKPPAKLFARLNPGVTLERGADGIISALFDGHAVRLGMFSASAAKHGADLTTGLRLDAFGSSDADYEKGIHELVRRLSRCGLLEYRLARARRGEDLVIIEPQVRDYTPRIPELGGNDVLVLSRFAYMRRRGTDMVLESPRAGALFRLCDADVAATIAGLSEPQTMRRLRRKCGFAGVELLALLVDCQILFVPDPNRDKGLRSSEGDRSLVLWDFHDLLFHARSTVGRHANPSGGVHAHAHLVGPLPAVRPRWPGKAIDLRKLAAPPLRAALPLAALLRRRHSTRDFDERHPITLAELAWFLDGTARIQSLDRLKYDDDDGPVTEIAARPYPSGGASYELELYLAVDRCEGLGRGFYHYDAARHALVPIEVSAKQLEAMVTDAQLAMGASAVPQILITITARFGRVSWKYSAIAYALILKHVGVVMQAFYLMATDMELGACAIGATDIDLFAKMAGIEFHVEGSVGQIAIGRGVDSESTPIADRQACEGR